MGEARALLGVTGPPVVARSRYWMRGLPQYGMDHAVRLETLRGLEESHAGLFVTGNFLAGMSTTACIAQDLATARRAAAYLGDGEMPSSLTGGMKMVINR
ncbi:MAG: hypothetical protein H7841_06705 [Magnetospirillum sp. WYHS-4]